MSQKRPTIIAGNWKMHKTIEEGKQFLSELIESVREVGHQVYLAVPFTAIQPLSELASNSNIVIGAQNMNDASEGAFTGEIAGRMLTEAGARFVLLGHSERRYIFGEGSGFVNRKVKRAFADRLQPIVCVGETKHEREQGIAEEVLKNQLLNSLEGLTSEQMESAIVAYEPVWAIGTGLTATSKEAEEMHHFCRRLIAEKWGEATAEKVPILYGGSVKPENTRELLKQPNIDGVLVGGASLGFESFLQIVNYQNTVCR